MTNVRDFDRFVKVASVVLIAFLGWQATRPGPAPAVPVAITQQDAARQVSALRISDQAAGPAARERSTRAINRCMPAALDKRGTVDWLYVLGCYQRTI